MKFKAETRTFILENLKCLMGLLSRLTVGYVFLESGWGKLHNIERVTGYFTSLALPVPTFTAYFVAGSEFAFGALLLLGFLTRLASIPLGIIMVVAILTAKLGEIKSFSDLLGTTEFLYLLILGWLAASGGGRVSIDNLCCKWCTKKK